MNAPTRDHEMAAQRLFMDAELARHFVTINSRSAMPNAIGAAIWDAVEKRARNGQDVHVDYVVAQLVAQKICDVDHAERVIRHLKVDLDVSQKVPVVELSVALTEDAIALELVLRHMHELRYVDEFGWLWFDGMCWRRVREHFVWQKTRPILRVHAETASNSVAKNLLSARTIASVEKLARGDSRVAASAPQFDRDGFMLNTPTGTVAMLEGKRWLHRPRDYLTKLTGTGPKDIPTPTFDRFAMDISCRNDAWVEYLRRVLYYCLTGDVRHHVLFFCVGFGANGKSTLWELVKFVMGNYAKIIPSDMLIESKHPRHPTDIAGLQGVRLAIASEISEGATWDDAKLKALTGDSTLTGRFMRMDYFEFERTHKLVVLANHKPRFRSIDHAMRRRLHVIPFNATFDASTMDPQMLEKLKHEAPGVLHWILGAQPSFEQAGLEMPSIIQEATDEYFCEQDDIGEWLQAHVKADALSRELSSALFRSFSDWKTLRGEAHGSNQRFSEALSRRYQKKRDSHGVWFCGLRLS